MPDPAETFIKVDNVSKIFKLPHEKNNSIKSAFINFYRRKRTYEMQQALKDVSFEVKKGEFFGIVGRNGSGKSTLLKLLAGIYIPDNGSVTINGKLTPFIELGVGFDMELSGKDNVFLNGALLGFSRKEMQSMYKDIVEFAELSKFMDQKLKNYSSGMQVRLAFSIAIRAESDILLIDEVLAVGDEAFQQKCFDYFKQLKKTGKTVVFVSHDMSSVKEFCDRGVLIDDGEVKVRGSAEEIARSYSSLFKENKDEPKVVSRRRGNGDARITKASASMKKDEITISATIKTYKPIDKLQYGIHLFGENEVEIAAMNNRMLQLPDITNLEANSEIVFEWKIHNIFNHGKYFAALTLADNEGVVLDHLTNAASFKINRPERSNTWVIPPMKISHTKIN